MTSSIDTNVLIDLWDTTPAVNTAARRLLERAQRSGRLVIMGCVYAELLAGPERSAAMVDTFLKETRIDLDLALPLPVYKLAGRKYGEHVARRRKMLGEEKVTTGFRRMLTDFLIGAHAEIHGFTLLTSDRRLFRVAFPGLRIDSGR